MPWKTIGYMLLAVIIVLFIAFNLNNTSDISFIFFTVENVPVFFTVFLSIIIGSLIMLPVALRMSSGKKRTKKEDTQVPIEQLLEQEPEQQPTKQKRGKTKKEDNEKLYGKPEKISDLDIR